MAKMITLETLFRFAGEQKVEETGMYTKGQNKAWNTIRAMCHSKDGFPTVDAEEIVRCRDCDYNDNGYCPVIERNIDDDFYCAEGWKRGGEDG